MILRESFRVVKQLFKTEKAESWFKNMFSGLKSIFAGVT